MIGAAGGPRGQRRRQRGHSAGGAAGLVVRRFLRAAAFEIVLSPAIAAEVLRALAYPKVQRLIRGDLDLALSFEDILVLADLVADAPHIAGICADPDDDKYVAAALTGRAGLIVTGIATSWPLGNMATSVS